MPVPTNAPELIVALDFENAKRARVLVQKLKGFKLVYKVGLELFTAEGAPFVRELVEGGHRVFLDLKLHDIPTTVAKTAKRVEELGVEFVTVHLVSGGKAFEAIRQTLNPEKGLRLVGVTVLTSFDDLRWKEITQAIALTDSAPSESATRLASLSRDWGVDCLVCSPHELKAIRAVRPEALLVVPGIRPEGVAKEDQARSMTPSQARTQGADALVIGRPITQAPDPVAALQGILKSLSNP